MLPAGADRMRKVGHADNAVVAVGVSVSRLDLAPVLGCVREFDPAAEVVGIRNDQRAGFAIKLDRNMFMPRHVEAHGHRDCRAARKQKRPRDMGRDFDRNALSRKRLAGHETFRPRACRHAADARDGTEKIDERGDIVGAHVEHGAASAEVVEAGIRVPTLVARTHEESRAANRVADEAVVDALARGLLPAAEESVRGAADAQASGRRRLDQFARFDEGDAERLLRVHVLARRD
jgi:hypothetical protein